MRKLVAFIGAPVIPAIIAAWVVALNRTHTPLSFFFFICLLFYALQVDEPQKAASGVDIPVIGLLWHGSANVTFIYLATYGERLLADYVLLYYPALLGSVTGLMFWVIARRDKTE
jgi:hypothetical protein